jgi:hypothetical protein
VFAVEISKYSLDEENLPKVEDMDSICAGLVVIDEQSSIKYDWFTTPCRNTLSKHGQIGFLTSIKKQQPFALPICHLIVLKLVHFYRYYQHPFITGREFAIHNQGRIL